ncbi:MAG: ATP-binding protein [Actinomycetota bacterium]
MSELRGAIIEAVPVGLILLDASLRIRYWNRAIEAYSGRHRRDALGDSVTHVLPQPLPQAHRISAVVETAAAFRLDQIARGTRDGEITEAYWFGPIMLEDNASGVLVVVDDVTHRIHVDTQLIRSERLAAIGELAAGVAHNFNNILAAIGGDAQLLKMVAEEERLPEHVIEAAQQICNETMRGGRIAHDLLSFARGAAPHIQRLEVRAVVDDAVRLIRNHPAARQVSIEVVIDRELPEVEADPHLLHQVFFNLMLNGLQAMPNGGTFTVSASLRGHEQDPQQGVLDLKFHDTGVGIAKERLRRIFDPFYSKRVGGGSGTGLGLSVSLAMVRSIGGDIRVASVEGIGTTVTLCLPIVERRLDLRSTYRRGRGRALVLESDESLGRTLAALLRRRGFETTVHTEFEPLFDDLAASGPEQPYQLVLMEWSPAPDDSARLPQRVSTVAPDAGVIILTDATEPRELAVALDQGADFVFSKPPNFTELLAVSEHLVRAKSPSLVPLDRQAQENG